MPNRDEWKDAIETRFQHIEREVEKLRDKMDNLYEKVAGQQAKLSYLIAVSSVSVTLMGFLIYKVYDVISHFSK